MALAEAPTRTNPLDALNTPFVRSSTKQTALALLWTLYDMDGEIRSENGTAGRTLVTEAQKIGYRVAPTFANVKSSSLTQLLGEMDHGRYAGLISREIGSRKTYAIKLLLTEDQMPPRPALLSVPAVKATVTDPPTPPDVEPEPEPPVETPEPEPVVPEPLEDVVDETTLVSVPTYAVEAMDPLDGALIIQQVAMQLAMGLATRMGQTAAPAPDQSDLVAARTKLAETLDENQRLRRKVAEVCETTNAKAKECEALRKALMVSSSNLKAMQQASGQGNQLERKLANLKNVQSFIASPPKAKAGV